MVGFFLVILGFDSLR